MRFQNKCVVVTGAGGGIGRETALEFAEEGAKVAVSDIDPKTAQRTAEEIVERGGQAQAFTLDTTDPEAVAAGFAAFESWLGDLDILVNNAGIREITPVIELTYEEWCRVINVNLTGVWLCSQTFVKRLLATDRPGAIVNLASTLGVVAAPNRPAYTASKHAVVGLTKQMALEFGEKGIRINAVGPGVTRTAMTAHYFEDPEITASIRSIHAMNRWAEVDEIARAILFLASDNASFITGTTLIVDGGWTTGKKM